MNNLKLENNPTLYKNFLFILTLLIPVFTFFHHRALFEISGYEIDARILFLVGTVGLLIILFALNYKTLKFDLIAKVFMVFLIYMAINSIFISQSIIWSMPTLLRFLGMYFFYIFSMNLFKSQNDVEKLLKYILASGIFPAIVGIIQYIFKLGLNINDAHRIYGSFSTHPLGFAFFLQILIGICVYFYYKNGRTINIYLGYIGLLMFLLIQTNTRLIFLTTVLLIFIIMILKKEYKKLLISGTIGLLYLVFIQKSLIYRVLSTLNMDSSTKFRYFVFKKMEPFFYESPIFGEGLGNFAYIFESLTGIDRVAPHNDYFGILIELGLIGLILYVLIQLIVLMRAVFVFESDLVKITVLLYLNTNIIGFLSNPNNYFEIQIYMWILLGAVRGYVVNSRKEKKVNICLAGSSGGHLTQLYQLKPWWEKHDRFWVTFDKQDSRSLLKDEQKYWCYHPTNRNIKNLIKNTFLAIKILIKERPDIIISTGAAPAIPFFYLGKLFGSKLIYVEVYDRIDLPTLTGKIVYPITDKFILQWEEQKKHYPKGEVLGGVL